MFGHNDQQPHNGSQPAPDGALDDQSGGAPQVNDVAGDYLEDTGPAAGTPTVTHPDDNAVPDSGDGTGDTDDTTGSSSDDAPTLPEPTASDSDDDSTGATADNSGDAGSEASTPATSTTSAPDTNTLLGIKQQALQQLTPLVGHLNQTPEEKFRTTMMMIQAADNHALIQDAYEAAKQITDEKVRAQALLDIVNEINYFTHNGAEAEEPQAA